ncbi:ABC transporter permease [Inquilinus limosus]|uniref:ABC transporter permease n=1 Tax=Inquilinus limosus MP06 TaxID=1398085 RepID=A0A0A0D6B9_9PROT|nr:ABC transporter permease [Inquilinus limosus]KGM32582.1 ABC transporter permease [Inquilinus limosus MP06]
MVDYQGLLQAGSPLRPTKAETAPVRSVIGTGAWRRILILAALAAIWEAAARIVGSPLLLPGFITTLVAFGQGVASGELPLRTLASLQVLVAGYAIGVVAAAILAGLATASRLGAELLSTLTAMFNPLPAIALLPIALLWFGLGTPSLLFVIVHSVLWPLALAAHAGFRAVPRPLSMVGQNLGLGGAAYVTRILVPAAFPAILAGLKIGWAFAWRTLIAAELVFGVSSRSGGLGWFIYVNRNQLETANVFAGLLAIILIGLLVESLLFRTLSRLTVERWGTQNP